MQGQIIGGQKAGNTVVTDRGVAKRPSLIACHRNNVLFHQMRSAIFHLALDLT